MSAGPKKVAKASRKSSWGAGQRVPAASRAAEERFWDQHSFAEAMDSAGEELVPSTAPHRPRSLVYRLRLDEGEMEALQRVARSRGMTIAAVIREMAARISQDDSAFDFKAEASALIRDPAANAADPLGAFANITVLNRGPFAARVRCFVQFCRDDGAPLFPTELAARWSSAPEPVVASPILTPEGIRFVHHLDVSKLNSGYTQDFAKGERQSLAVAIKFADNTCWGWTQESYQHNWRHPAWPLPSEVLRVRIRLSSGGRDFQSEFRLDCRSPVESFAAGVATGRQRSRPRPRLPDVPYLRLLSKEDQGA